MHVFAYFVVFVLGVFSALGLILWALVKGGQDGYTRTIKYH